MPSGSLDKESPHEPVMVDEVLGFLSGRPVVVDMTLGAGGHARALLESGVGRVIGVDRDPRAVELASPRLEGYGDRFEARSGLFSEVDLPEGVDGVLYDLGVSSMQLEDAERGFSFRLSGPLDMRMGEDEESAKDLVNRASEEDLLRLLRGFGEERHARRIARAIVRARTPRPIESTDELARVVTGAVGRRPGHPHPARRTFQALRIAVNRELEELATTLPRAVSILAPGGRIVVISYHSLEDRIVKRFFLAEPLLQVLTKKIVRPTDEEVARNPRSRGAKLRAAEKLPEAA
ncbi:MAG: 16S rRNA (cytosine(1402)-N(4))-methyltransferase RsmH [Actinomycetota bacterium]